MIKVNVHEAKTQLLDSEYHGYMDSIYLCPYHKSGIGHVMKEYSL